MPPRDWSWIPTGKHNTHFDLNDGALRSPLQLADAFLTVASNLGSISMKSADAEASTPPRLEVPFCSQVDGYMFDTMSNILAALVARLKSASDSDKPAAEAVLCRVLQLLRLNLQSLRDSGVAPAAVDISLYVCVVGGGGGIGCASRGRVVSDRRAGLVLAG